MENFQSLDPIRGLSLYYSCDYPDCKKTIKKPVRNLLQMPQGWLRVFEKDENGNKVTKHYCIKHNNFRNKMIREANSEND